MQKTKPLTLRRNFSWTFTGNAVYSACQWGMLVVMAKLGNPEMVGQFTLALAVTVPVIMLTNLQLSAIQATDAKQEYSFEDYFGLRLITTSLAIIIIIGITVLGGYRQEVSRVILVMGFAKAFESISEVIYGLIQQHERMDRIAISMMIKGPLSLLMLAAGVYLTHTVFWGVVGLAIAWLIVLLSYDIHSGLLMLNGYQYRKIGKRFGKFKSLALLIPLRPRWQVNNLKKIVSLALPLGFVMMLLSLNGNIPRYFIVQYLGERELGIFAAISYLIVATGMVIAALGQSAGPRLAKYYVVGNSRAFCTLLLKLVGIGLILGIAGLIVVMVAGSEILTFFYRPEYAKHTDLLVWLMITSCVSNVAAFLGNGISAARYFRIQLPLFVIVTSTSAVTCLYLIPHMGLKGAVFAQIIAAIIQVILSLGIIYNALRKITKSVDI